MHIFLKIPYSDRENLDESFDLVMSIGVIHHLSDPKLAVTKLFNKVKKDGMLLIWVYGFENEILIRLLNMLRLFTTSLPYKLVAVIGKFCIFYMEYLNLSYKIRVLVKSKKDESLCS